MKARTRRKPPQIVYDGDEPSAVILSIADYRELLERAEDAEDLKLLARMRARPLKFKNVRDFLAEHSPRV